MLLIISVIIVVYNKNVNQSITYERIKGINLDSKNIRLIIIDNSNDETVSSNNKLFCQQNKVNYVSMDGNKGLSKAYNKAIDLEINSTDLFVLMDDDTEITAQYFDELILLSEQNSDVDVFAPVIYGQNGVIYSPNEFSFMRNNFIKKPEDNVEQTKFNAIASCLAIRKNVFLNYRFNEFLFIDQVDQNLLYDLRKKKVKFLKMNTIIHQNFYQRGCNINEKNAWNRLQLRLRDILRQTIILGGQYKLLGFIKCIGLAIQIGLKCHSITLTVKAMILSVKLYSIDIIKETIRYKNIMKCSRK